MGNPATDSGFYAILFRVLKGLEGLDVDQLAAVLKKLEQVVKDDPTFEPDLEEVIANGGFQNWFKFVAKHAKTVTVLTQAFGENFAVLEHFAQFVQR